MKTKTINYAGVMLEVAECLEEIWPYNLPFDDWPSFCGAGAGIGDWIVSDIICGVKVACCCFDHDVSWVLAPNTVAGCMKANLRFYLNIRNLVLRHSKRSRFIVETKCFVYFLAVSTIGRKFFSGLGELKKPLEHPEIVSRLRRLEIATVRSGL